MRRSCRALAGDWQRPTLVIDRMQGSTWRGFVALVQLGIAHIQHGTDHRLFLLMLLLPAPLLARGHRWTTASGVRASLQTISGIVTAFTVGHSLTLLVGALQGAALPTSPVEILVAVSILVTAVHAWRPMFAGREMLVAAGFGLVHGLAFARELLGFGFDGQSLTLALLGLNLGIEAMQLAIVALVMPWLMLASRSAHYAWIRNTGAAFGGIAASGLIAARAFGLPSVVPPAVERVAAAAPWLLGLLAFTALALNARSWFGRDDAVRSTATGGRDGCAQPSSIGGSTVRIVCASFGRMERTTPERILAVRTAEYLQQVGTQRYAGLPREEIERLYASVELHALTSDELTRESSSYLPVVTYTAVHYNYTWLTYERAERSLGVSGPVYSEGEPPLFLDESLELAARRELENARVVAAPVDWRLAGLIHDGQLGLVYIARLRSHWSPEQNRSAGRVTCCNSGELKTERHRFEPWSQLLIDNLPSL